MKQAMAPPHSSFFHVLLSCFLVAATTTMRSSDAAGAPQLQDFHCSTEGNYTATDAYAGNLNQLLAAVPITTVSTNGGFFNGTVGQGAATVYGLAMCYADFSRADCTDCLTAASSNGTGLLKRCPGSVTASIMFDQCMIRYSNSSFFGNNETDIVFDFTSSEIVPTRQMLSNNLKQGLAYLSAQAAMSPERFAASSTAPFALVQCTWDLPSDKCKACIDTLSANASNLFQVGIQGERKSYSCRVRYSNASFTVVPLLDPTLNQSSSVNPTAGPAKKAIIAGAVTGTLVVVGSTITMILVIVSFIKKRPRYVNGVRVMPLDLLTKITHNFSEERMLGTGTFGTVYKGVEESTVCVQKNVTKIAVKRLHSTPELVGCLDKDFSNELEILSKLKHPNIIRLLGYCHETKKEQAKHDGRPTTVQTNNRALCFEYMKGSLQQKLQKGDELIKWQDCYNIIKGICEGLKYLHKGLNNPIFHLDLKPSNILLDKNMVPKIADFGLSKLVRGVTEGTTISGTKGYRPPEYIKDSLITEKYDIFSLGVVMLEIIAGKDDYTNIAEQEMPSKEFIDAAEENWKRRLHQETQHQTQVKRCIQIALDCVRRDPNQRPDIAMIIIRLLNKDENNTEQLATSDTASLIKK